MAQGDHKSRDYLEKQFQQRAEIFQIVQEREHENQGKRKKYGQTGNEVAAPKKDDVCRGDYGERKENADSAQARNISVVDLSGIHLVVNIVSAAVFDGNQHKDHAQQKRG